MMKRLLLALLGLSLSWAGGVALEAQDSTETLREQQKALQAEQEDRQPASATMSSPSPLEGPSELVFVGVDDPTVSTYVIDPANNNSLATFTGVDVWGAAVIPGGSPGDAVVYFNDGSMLYRYQDPGPPTFCCNLQFAAANATVVSVAYDAVASELLFTRNIAPEAVYSMPITAGACPATCDLTQEIVYASGDNDFGGLAYDSVNDVLYGTNDDATPGPAGVYEINPDGTTSLVVAYPAGETDIDALAYAGGILYLVTDEPGDIYVYNIGTASFEAPLTNPWTTSEVFAGAGAGTGLIVPVTLQGFSID